LTDNCHVFFTEALKFFKNQLSPYEQSEILGYKELWFLGLEAEKLNIPPEKFSATSFDDEHGSYMKVLVGGGGHWNSWVLETRDSVEKTKKSEGI
jgi:hypothetical protein